jgi:hypothetical protein
MEIFYGPDDGLEREFRIFNQLEGGVCTTCAPGYPEKSIGGKSAQSLRGVM